MPPEIECAGWPPIHPARAHPAAVSHADRAGPVRNHRRLPIYRRAVLDPPNGGHLLLIPPGAYYDGGLTPKLSALSEIALFAALSENELQGLAQRAVEKRFAPD